jgi:hypothetical protein
LARISCKSRFLAASRFSALACLIAFLVGIKLQLLIN